MNVSIQKYNPANDIIVQRIDSARMALMQAKDAGDAKKIKDMAYAAEVYARRQKLSEEVISHAHAIKVDAEILLGDFLRFTEKNKGSKGTGSNQHKRVVRLQSVTTPTLKDLNLSKRESAESQFLSKLNETEPEIVEDIRSGNKTIKEAKNIVYKKAESQKKSVVDVVIKSEEVQLHNCDILAAPIEDNSLDVILTDPPYPRDHLDCWRRLAEFAVKKLKKNGVLIALSGQSYLPEVYKNMTIEGLDYYWTGCIYTPKVSPNLQTKRLRTNWKPFLFYVKGDYNRTFQSTDVYVSDYKDTAEGQEYHKWGQSYPVIEKMLCDYTYAGETVCDPFLGGGTTAIACINNKRKFVGVEIDKKTFNIASNRIKDVL